MGRGQQCQQNLLEKRSIQALIHPDHLSLVKMAPDDNGPSGAKSTRRNKVARLIEEYDLGDSYGEELERLWTGKGEQRESLRSLAKRFNKRLLTEAIEGSQMSTIDGSIDNIYRILTSDEVSSGKQIEAQNQLRQAGVDVESLETDFVTYQAIRSYLKDYREAEYKSSDPETKIENGINNIQRLQSRLQSVGESTLNQLKNSDLIHIGSYRLFVEVTVTCEDCNMQYGLVEFLRKRKCECSER